MLALTVKESVNPEILLEKPKEVIDDPMPRPETPGDHETVQAVTDREARDRLRRDRVILENEERSERGPKERRSKTRFENDLRLVYFWHWAQKERKNSYKKIHILKSQKLCSERW